MNNFAQYHGSQKRCIHAWGSECIDTSADLLLSLCCARCTQAKRCSHAWNKLLPAFAPLLLVPELEEQVLRAYTVPTKAIDAHAQALQLCLLLGLLLRAFLALLDRFGDGRG